MCLYHFCCCFFIVMASLVKYVENCVSQACHVTVFSLTAASSKSRLARLLYVTWAEAASHKKTKPSHPKKSVHQIFHPSQRANGSTHKKGCIDNTTDFVQGILHPCIYSISVYNKEEDRNNQERTKHTQKEKPTPYSPQGV